VIIDWLSTGTGAIVCDHNSSLCDFYFFFFFIFEESKDALGFVLDLRIQ
jgi:hypothetical protein